MTKSSDLLLLRLKFFCPVGKVFKIFDRICAIQFYSIKSACKKDRHRVHFLKDDESSINN